MMDFRNSNGGLMGSMRLVSESAMSIFRNRAELAALEVKEEKSRLISGAVWSGIFIFSAIMAVIAITCTLLFYFWAERLNLAIGLFIFFLVGSLVAFLIVKRRIKAPKPFAETIAQFKKDRAWLRG